jgi:hypothetical protein
MLDRAAIKVRLGSEVKLLVSPGAVTNHELSLIDARAGLSPLFPPNLADFDAPAAGDCLGDRAVCAEMEQQRLDPSTLDMGTRYFPPPGPPGPASTICDASESKWNSLRARPPLVPDECGAISVHPVEEIVAVLGCTNCPCPPYAAFKIGTRTTSVAPFEARVDLIPILACLADEHRDQTITRSSGPLSLLSSTGRKRTFCRSRVSVLISPAYGPLV